MMTSEQISEALSRLHIEDSSGNKSKFATEQHLAMWRDILRSASNFDAFHQLNRLENAWQSLASDQGERPRDDLGSHLIFRLINDIDSGDYPPPEILLVISNLFKYYVKQEGNISLDEAFFGRRHAKSKSIAHLSKGWDDHKIFNSMLEDTTRHFEWEPEWDMYPFREPHWSLEECAEAFLTHRYRNNHPTTPDVDSFLRAFRRWKKANSTSKSP